MNIRKQASSFTIYVLSQDADLGSTIRLDLNQAGYQAYFFADFDEMQVRVISDPPHLIIVDHQSLVISLNEFFEKVLTVSSEIKIICLSDAEYFSSFSDFKEYNLVHFSDRNQKNISFQILSTVDLVCESLFRLYQNEQLLISYEEKTKSLIDINEARLKERMAPQIRPFQMRITEYRTAESKDELLQIFFRQTPQQSWVFLKYVKSIETYIAVSNQNMPEDWVEGLSFKIPAEELMVQGENRTFNDRILIGEFPESLVNYLKSKWSVPALKILPLILKKEIEGLFVTTQDIEATVAEDFSLMSLVYAMLSLESQPQYLEIEDSLTGFYNHIFYKRILEKEIDRSRRAFKALSVIKLSVDTFREIESSYGRHFCDEVLKKVAEVIKKTSRAPDFACRTAENEFSIILTDCNRKGAALRSERLRQQLKLESFSQNGIVITLSQGISEYPSLTKTAMTLSESATKALEFIATKGGDKICIFKAPQDHKPDFQVNT